VEDSRLERARGKGVWLGRGSTSKLRHPACMHVIRVHGSGVERASERARGKRPHLIKRVYHGSICCWESQTGLVQRSSSKADIIFPKMDMRRKLGQRLILNRK
jgi:hypothetical protein